MIKQLLLAFIASFVNIGVVAQDKLLIEYNNEIEPFFKVVLDNRKLIQSLVDKEHRGEILTKNDLEKNLKIECNTLISINKISDISNKAKYLGLKKAHEVKEFIPKIKENMIVNTEKCKNK